MKIVVTDWLYIESSPLNWTVFQRGRRKDEPTGERLGTWSPLAYCNSMGDAVMRAWRAVLTEHEGEFDVRASDGLERLSGVVRDSVRDMRALVETLKETKK